MFTGLSIVRSPKVSSTWTWKDYFGTLKVRLSFGRDNYLVKPGLYAFQNPGPDSHVFVTANYKLSFDILRKELAGFDAWILVLDTKGINVWCAAGKGTFGSAELVRQINETKLSTVINHKRLIVPQLGAPGVSAIEVKEATGFNVKFGPVRAADIKDYIAAGLKKNDEMRRVKFDTLDRLKIVPVELVVSMPKFLLVLLGFLALSGITSKGYSVDEFLNFGLKGTLVLLSAYFSGAALTPFLLPWVPFRSFAAKGLIVSGLVVGFILLVVSVSEAFLPKTALLLLGLAISSFLAMNFTGASTYTSLSGVRKEMRIFVPVQLTLASIGLIAFILSRFIIF